MYMYLMLSRMHLCMRIYIYIYTCIYTFHCGFVRARSAFQDTGWNSSREPGGQFLGACPKQKLRFSSYRISNK